jgi:hypothetical protein
LGKTARHEEIKKLLDTTYEGVNGVYNDLDRRLGRWRRTEGSDRKR